MCLSIIFEMAASEVAPTTRSSSWPPLKRISVGMPLMPNRCDTDGLSSTFSFTTRALPAYFSATASTVGASMRQGAHHSAQKSTKTGWAALSTSASKLLSLTSVTYSLMYFSPYSPCSLAHSSHLRDHAIKLDVLARRRLPRIVCAHAVQLNRAPDFRF